MPRETPVKHRDLRGHSAAYRCWRKSLIGNALMRFGVRQHARRESISKRAPSTTRTSLRFRINDLRAVWNRIAQNLPSRISDSRCRVLPTRYASADNRIESNCVRPLNVVGSLTAIFESKRIDQRSQRSRLLPSTGVIEEEAGEGRAPIFEDSDQRAACEVRRNVILQRERAADTVTRRRRSSCPCRRGSAAR
jgi:hypothetical protein